MFHDKKSCLALSQYQSIKQVSMDFKLRKPFKHTCGVRGLKRKCFGKTIYFLLSFVLKDSKDVRAEPYKYFVNDGDRQKQQSYYNGANLDVSDSPKLTCGGNIANMGGSRYYKSSSFTL